MDKLVEMPNDSQGGAAEPILFLRVDGRPIDLWEAATCRLDNARNLLDALIGSTTRNGAGELSAVAAAAAMLLADAYGMLEPIYPMLRELEQLREEMKPIQLIKPDG